MNNCYRVILGSKNMHAKECLSGSFIGADFDINEDLKNQLPDRWQDFNERYRPVWMSAHPDKTKVAAGLACGALWTISKGILVGDTVICPDGDGNYLVCEVIGPYYYEEGQFLPHRRPVRWLDKRITKADMSESLQNSIGSIGTQVNASKYRSEIEQLIDGKPMVELFAVDEHVEDPTVFGLEKHLEEFLVANWNNTELGATHDIYEVEGEVVGQQFASDTGPMDILAISKDKKELLVVELKKGRASDVVVGQILRYMGYAQSELAEEGQIVKGVIIGLEGDKKLKNALSVIPNITFYRYKVDFKLIKGLNS